MPVEAPEKTEKQIVTGPDGKKYSFSKSIPQARIDKYFTKQGWIKKDGKWLTATGEPIPSRFTTGKELADIQKRKSEVTGQRADEQSAEGRKAALDYTGAAMPATMATGFSLAAGGKTNPIGVGMASLGGMAGQSANEIIQRLAFSRSAQGRPTGSEGDTNTNTVKGILWEGVKQGGLELAGRKAGEVFFNLLNKIPHAQIKEGIQMLPGDIGRNGKIYRYMEDLLTNLIPSAKTLEEFKIKQTEQVIAKADTLVQGMSRFNGTSEELGVLLRDAITDNRNRTKKALDSMYDSYRKAGHTPAQAFNYLNSTKLAKEFAKNFDNELAKRIIATNKPELLAGYIRKAAGLEDTRTVASVLKEISPELTGKIQNRIMRDVIMEAMTGTKDPMLISTQKFGGKFVGNKFRSILDDIGEEKLKAIYGQTGYDSIQKFVALTGGINSGTGAGPGKFLNLMFAIPFRSGVSGKAISKTAILAFGFNRAAKIITSPEGMRLYENVIRSSVSQTPKALSLAMAELNKFNERSDAEIAKEQEQAEAEYNQSKEKNKEKK